MATASEAGVSTALELFDLGVQLRAERFRREHRAASDAEVNAFIQAWLLERPGAPDGDAPGRPWPATGRA